MSRPTAAGMDAWYADPDPWGYLRNPYDAVRKRRILDALPGRFSCALDLCCGEGFIAADLPADHVWAYDLSAVAMSRLPPRIVRAAPGGLTRVFDLVLLCDCLYDFYDWEWMVETANRVGSAVLLTCTLADKEHAPAVAALRFTQLSRQEFPYKCAGDPEPRQQRLRLWRKNGQS